MDQVASEVLNGVATIRFDRMDAENALTSAMCESAADALSLAEGTTRVRAILIAGTPGIFANGQDRTELAADVRRGSRDPGLIRLLKTVATIDKPVVAAVDGLAAGIGTTLLFLCDYVVASEWSSFVTPFVHAGLPPEAAVTLLAPRALGYHRAFGLLVMGEEMDAAQALAAGLVNRVVGASEVEAAGLEAARRLATLPPEAVRLTRRIMRGDRREVVSRIDQESAGFGELLRSPAARDALMAYIGGKG